MENKKRTTKAFLRRYFRVIVAGTVLLAVFIVGIFAPLICEFDPDATDMHNMNKRPDEVHKFGTDKFGRDIFARVVYGTRVSLAVSFAVAILALVIGTILGLLVGYYPVADRTIMRLLEGFNALPGILLAITLITVLGNGVDKLIIAMVIGRLPGIARLVRTQVLSLKEKEFTECAIGSGASDFRILFKYILPECYSVLIIQFTSSLGGVILSQSSLAFLGVGIDPRIPTWGGVINEGRTMVMAMPYQCAYAGFAIMITTLAFSILGDGIRDILDPKLR